MDLGHAREIDGAENVDVVDHYWLFSFRGCGFGYPRVAQKQMGGFFQTASGIEQNIFARNVDVHAEIVIHFQVIDHFVAKMVDVDNYVSNSKRAKTRERNFQESASVDFHQSFGAVVSKRTKARAEPSGQDHRLHGVGLSSSR